MPQYVSGSMEKLIFQRPKTESFPFYLHYRVTFLLLMTCSFVVSANIIIGVPIVCDNAVGVSPFLMDSYCWSHGTYSVASAYAKNPEEVPYPGIDNSEDGSDYIYREYYQWIYFLLFVQGVLFYLPRGIWKNMEGGKMENLVKNIENPPRIQPTSGEEDAETSRIMSRSDKLFAGAVFLHKRWGCYNNYAFGYLICEFLSWLNVVFQAYILNFLFHGEFFALGTRVGQFFSKGHFYNNSLLMVFPRVANCHFQKFGASNKVVNFDVLCVLSVNALTEKIFLFIWFWLFALFVVSSLSIVLMTLTAVFPKFRGYRLSCIVSPITSHKSKETKVIASYVGKFSGYGDWFVLSVLAPCMDILDFKQFISYLQDEILRSTLRNKNLKEGKVVTAL